MSRELAPALSARAPNAADPAPPPAARGGSLFWKLWHGASSAHLPCADCGAALNLRGLKPGGRARCGKCGSVFTVPGSVPPRRGETAAETSVLGEPSAAADEKPSALTASGARALFEKPPEKVGAYLVEAEIARGGTAIVFKGRHETLGKPVAIKLLTPDVGERFSIAAQGEMSRRLFREALTLARFRHAHIVPVLDAGQMESGAPYLVMEYVDGEDLARRLKHGGPMAEKAALETLAQVIEGVDFAHAQGVVHRDLKPANILIDRLGDAQLVDFGLARDDTAGSRLTQSGVALGTPSYMPPEQARGEREKIGPRADIYSLGAILYEMLTGRPPFEGQQVMQVLYKVCHDDPRPPRALNPKVSREAEAICLKAMEKDPARRYASAHQMLQDVRALLKGEAPPVAWAGRGSGLVRFLRRRGLWGWKGALAALVVLTVLGAWAERRERQRQVRRLVHEGRELLKEGDYDQAEERYVEAMQRDPNDAAAFLGLRDAKRMRDEAARRKAAEAQRKDEEIKKLLEKLKLDPAKLDPSKLQELIKSAITQFDTTVTSIIKDPDEPAAPANPPKGEEKAAPAVEVPVEFSAAPGTRLRVFAVGAPEGSAAAYDGAPARVNLVPGVYLVKYRAEKPGQSSPERAYILPIKASERPLKKVTLPFD
ncbi:MAG: protein kinase [Planctomycetota bacterium]|nr:protein kinase [Planctomycetota bacterium]